MAKNRDRLRRTADGRYDVGIYTKRDEHGRFVAQLFLRYEGIEEPILAKTMGPEPTFQLAATAARSWTQEHIPAMFHFDPEDLVVAQLDRPEFA